MATMEDKYKRMSNYILQSGLDFGGPISKNDSGVTNPTIQPDPTKQVNSSGNANSEILGGTIRDLLPAIFGVGAGLIGSKAGLRPNDALGLGITTLNTATSVQDTYRNNRQKYYGRLASKIIDEYIAESGGKIDKSMIYTRLEKEQPDIFKHISPADVLSQKIAERNKVIDMSTKEYKNDLEQKTYYDSQKYTAFENDSELLSQDMKVGPSMSFRYTGRSAMMKRLKSNFGPDKYVVDNGIIRFKNQEDYDKFVSDIQGKGEFDPDKQEHVYDMNQVLMRVKPPVDNSAKNRELDLRERNMKLKEDMADFKKKNAGKISPTAMLRFFSEGRRLQESDTSGTVSNMSLNDIVEGLIQGEVSDDYRQLTSTEKKQMSELENDGDKALTEAQSLLSKYKLDTSIFVGGIGGSLVIEELKKAEEDEDSEKKQAILSAWGKYNVADQKAKKVSELLKSKQPSSGGSDVGSGNAKQKKLDKSDFEKFKK